MYAEQSYDKLYCLLEHDFQGVGVTVHLNQTFFFYLWAKTVIASHLHFKRIEVNG